LSKNNGTRWGKQREQQEPHVVANSREFKPGLMLVRIERFTLSSRPKLVACVLTGTLGLSMTVAAGSMWHHIAAQQRDTQAELTRVQTSRPIAPPARADVSRAETLSDFVQTVPSVIEARPVLADIQRMASRTGISLAGVQVQPRAPAPESLGRLDLTLSLRGSYANVKQLSGDLLDRHPNMTLSHLTMRKTASPTDLETSIVLTLWGAPLATGSADSLPSVGR
jgi:Tfp pilus assembly protein PilO